MVIPQLWPLITVQNTTGSQWLQEEDIIYLMGKKIYLSREVVDLGRCLLMENWLNIRMQPENEWLKYSYSEVFVAWVVLLLGLVLQLQISISVDHVSWTALVYHFYTNYVTGQ